MQTFQKVCAQGELHIVRVDQLPEGLAVVPASNGHIIVGHSETGHHHVMDVERTTMYRLPEAIYEWFLVVKEEDELKHLRPFDTHETIQFTPGVYRVHAGREYVSKQMRPSRD